MLSAYWVRKAIAGWSISLADISILCTQNNAGATHVEKRHRKDYKNKNIVETIVKTLEKANKAINGEDNNVKVRVGIRDEKIVLLTEEDYFEENLKSSQGEDLFELLKQGMMGARKSEVIKNTIVLNQEARVITSYPEINEHDRRTYITREVKNVININSGREILHPVPAFFTDNKNKILTINPINPRITANMMKMFEKGKATRLIIPYKDIINHIESTRNSEEIIRLILALNCEENDKEKAFEKISEIERETYMKTQNHLITTVVEQTKDFLEREYGVDVSILRNVAIFEQTITERLAECKEETSDNLHSLSEFEEKEDISKVLNEFEKSTIENEMVS